MIIYILILTVNLPDSKNKRFHDRESSRPRYLEDAQPETNRDRAKVVETETFVRVSLITELVD